MNAAVAQVRRWRMPGIGRDVFHTKPSIATPQVVASAIGFLYLAGGVLALTALHVSPQPQAENTAVNAALCIASIVAGLVTMIFGARFPAWVYHPLVAAATVAIAAGTWLGGGGVTSLGFAALFNFVALDSFFFFAWPLAIAHLAFVNLCAFTAFAHVHMAMSQAVLVLGCATTVALVVGWLARAAAAGDRDAVTGVANRRGFDKALQAAVTSATRTETPLSVIMMDFDRFKAVNDRGGHAAGDRLLRNSAVHWSSLLRPGQTLARFGGDEFAVLLPGCPAGRAAAVADHLRTAIGGETTCSAGVAELRPFDSGSMLVARADVALYEAKTRGRDRTVQHGIEARVEAARFSSALAAGQFQLCYQPIVSLRTRRVIGAEATLRWLDGGGDIKADAAFGAAAERSAAVRGIGSWIVRQACTHATVEPGADGMASYIAVSASRSELCSHDYVHTVLTALRETATAPSRLVVEISESTLDTDQAEVIDTLNALRAQGVRIAVDDFGISLASLSRLNRRPVDILKIDRSFVAAIGYAPSAEPILRAMVSLAEALGMTTVADGVDTQLQADTLADVGCRAGQGSMFGRPRPHPRADADVSVLAMNRTAGQ